VPTNTGHDLRSLRLAKHIRHRCTSRTLPGQLYCLPCTDGQIHSG
jgi:hypothetical protein